MRKRARPSPALSCWVCRYVFSGICILWLLHIPIKSPVEINAGEDGVCITAEYQIRFQEFAKNSLAMLHHYTPIFSLFLPYETIFAQTIASYEKSAYPSNSGFFRIAL